MATVSARLREGTRVDVRAGEFSWLSDEPVAVGGTGTGPEPYELLLASLASCISLTLRFYADHKEIDLTGVDVELEFDRIHAEDCQACEDDATGWIDRIQTKVTIHGTFTEAQRKRLAQIVGRCPVHRTLVRDIRIFDSVSFAETTAPENASG